MDHDCRWPAAEADATPDDHRLTHPYHDERTALEHVAALFEHEAEREWLGQSAAGRWFGDLPGDDCPW